MSQKKVRLPSSPCLKPLSQISSRFEPKNYLPLKFPPGLEGNKIGSKPLPDDEEQVGLGGRLKRNGFSSKKNIQMMKRLYRTVKIFIFFNLIKLNRKISNNNSL